MQLLQIIRAKLVTPEIELRLSVLFFVLMTLWLIPSTLYAFWPFAEPVYNPPEAAVQEEAGSVVSLSQPVVKTDEAEALQQQVRKMAAELFGNLEDPDPANGILADGVFVCTFVDLKKLYRTSSFGRYLAEQLMSEFQKKEYTVVEMRKSLSVMVQEKHGEYGMSRDPAEISSSVAAGAMLTGTYMETEENIIVNAKIIDNRTATLLSSATAVFPRNKLCGTLLSDASSAVKRQPEPIYMKRLEL